MAQNRIMSSKVSRLFQKWPCFGGKTAREFRKLTVRFSARLEVQIKYKHNQCVKELFKEDIEENSLRLNQPKIIITECKSVESSPNISRKSTSSESSSSVSYDETETEIRIKTDDKVHEMGMSLVLKTRPCSEDEVDGEKREVTSMISVSDVKLGSFAHGFGVRKGDIVSKINDKECVSAQEMKNAFLYKKSDDLQMEILRKKNNLETGGTEFIKMIISNESRIGGINTENELEIIQVEMGSNWSLSDNEKYFHQDPVETVYLQFAITDTPWMVGDGERLALTFHLSASEEGNARFLIHKYWSMSTSSETGFPVVIQHVQSQLCVTFNHESIHLEKIDDLHTVEGSTPFLFYMHTELVEGVGINMTFQSLLDRSRYLGFNVGAGSEAAYAEPIHVTPTYKDNLGNKHDKVVFILTYL